MIDLSCQSSGLPAVVVASAVEVDNGGIVTRDSASAATVASDSEWNTITSSMGIVVFISTLTTRARMKGKIIIMKAKTNRDLTVDLYAINNTENPPLFKQAHSIPAGSIVVTSGGRDGVTNLRGNVIGTLVTCSVPADALDAYPRDGQYPTF